MTTGCWPDYLINLEQVLIKLQENGLKCNIDKPFFGQWEIEYLGLWITFEGVRPTETKFEDIVDMDAPRNRKEVSNLSG